MEVKYAKFEAIFVQRLDKHAPLKRKVLRANDKPYMTSTLRKAMMMRSALQNRFYRNRILETEKAFKKQELHKKTFKWSKKRYFSSINIINFTDNKMFWKTVKPLFSNYNGGSQNITLIDNANIVSKPS